MVEKFEVMISPFNCIRQVHVYLPDDYYQNQERYPVMYMYDGHNLFYDSDATYGKSWGLKEFMDQYDKKVIIVGIECDHKGNQRLSEYCPYDLENSFLGPIKGRGKEFMDWFVYEFKEIIDQRYRTIPFRECCGIGGSSMGGLMALYTVIKYNQYFSKAACISPAISMCFDQLKKDFKQNQIDSDTRVYFSFGTREVRGKSGINWMLKNITWFNDEIVKLHGHSYINVVKNGRHNEASWEKENPTYFDFLWK
ncbi:MAG: alpha/beta hydrolase [Thomasclavelia sp.]